MDTFPATSRPDKLIRTNFFQRHPLVSYFIGAYLLAWITWIPLVFGKGGLGWLSIDPPFLPIAMLSTYTGPALVSILITGIIGGWGAVARLLKRLVLFRVGIQWYLLAFYAVVVVELLMTCFALGSAPLAWIVANPIQLIFLLPGTVVTSIYAPLGEEIGWRGFALPRLQKRYGALGGSLLLGLLWGCWHAPLFLFVPAFLGKLGFLEIVLYILSAIATALFMSWIFNNTRGSLLLAILTHSSVNFVSTSILSLIGGYDQLNTSRSNNLYAIGLMLLGIIALAATRGTLGYKPETQPEL